MPGELKPPDNDCRRCSLSAKSCEGRVVLLVSNSPAWLFTTRLPQIEQQ
ncbi:MAG: hypothetical protein LBQ50_10275 [Planctomycetaceae bacterium]|nr:hypothetical protein [Planctomycetaceae bacterium]